ncbi:hypothetical protein BJ165DRAFT_1411436 [Panaeolus papilionaceus]|nr:hypothetical protein BJ165DRAFT_1411436 [Panaeolus papilionaceus]
MSRRVFSHQPPSSSPPNQVFSESLSCSQQKMRLWGSTLRTTSLLEFSNITAIGLGQVRAYKRCHHNQRTVLSLDPTKLIQVKQPAIDISGIKNPSISLPRGSSTVYFIHEGRVHLPFPDGTRGFLYYHTPANRPRISGQLRFRITPSDDPASFPCGYDLDTLRTTHSLPYPWNVSILKLVGGQHYTNLVSQLVSEGLVEETLVQSGGDRIWSRMDFKSGIVRLRFERSTLPEHHGRRVVVARCLEVIEPLVVESPTMGKDMDPLDVATYIPVPGQLLQTLASGYQKRYSHPKPWGIDISDDSEHLSAPALRLLW